MVNTVTDIPIGPLTLLEPIEIGACHSKPRIENRKLHARTRSIPVRVEEQPAGAGLVDDPIRCVG